MDGGSFYGQGVSLSRSAVPGMSYPFPSASYEPTSHAAGTPFLKNWFADISFTQKVDQIVSLVREQAKETATIKEELSALRSEMNKIRQNSKFLTESVSSSDSSTPVNVTKKIPAEWYLYRPLQSSNDLQTAVKLLHESGESKLQFTGAEPYAFSCCAL